MDREGFMPGWFTGMLCCVLVLGTMKGCNERSAYSRKPCDACGAKADQYMAVKLKLCPACACKMYELKKQDKGADK